MDVVASWVTLMSVVPDLAVLSTVAVPTVVLEPTAACEVKREGEPRVWRTVLSWPRLVPMAPRSVL